MELTNQSVSELLQLEPPISDENPVTTMFAETALETAGVHFNKAVASLFVAMQDERIRSAELNMMVTAMMGAGDALIESAQRIRQQRQNSPPPGEEQTE